VRCFWEKGGKRKTNHETMIDGSHLRFESIAHDHDGHDRTGSLCLRSDQPRVCFWAHRWWLFQSRLFRTPSASCVSRHPTPPAPGGFGPCGRVSHMCLFLPNASVDATRYYYGWNSFFWSTLFLSRCAIFIRLETRRVGLPFCVRTFYLRFDASQHLVSYSFWLFFWRFPLVLLSTVEKPRKCPSTTHAQNEVMIPNQTMRSIYLLSKRLLHTTTLAAEISQKATCLPFSALSLLEKSACARR
jgi:hypothetical protein